MWTVVKFADHVPSVVERNFFSVVCGKHTTHSSPSDTHDPLPSFLTILKFWRSVFLQNTEAFLDNKGFYDFGFGNETAYYDITKTKEGIPCSGPGTDGGQEELFSKECADTCFVGVYCTDAYLGRARQVRRLVAGFSRKMRNSHASKISFASGSGGVQIMRPGFWKNVSRVMKRNMLELLLLYFSTSSVVLGHS